MHIYKKIKINGFFRITILIIFKNYILTPRYKLKFYRTKIYAVITSITLVNLKVILTLKKRRNMTPHCAQQANLFILYIAWNKYFSIYSLSPSIDFLYLYENNLKKWNSIYFSGNFEPIRNFFRILHRK